MKNRVDFEEKDGKSMFEVPKVHFWMIDLYFLIKIKLLIQLKFLLIPTQNEPIIPNSSTNHQQIC